MEELELRRDICYVGRRLLMSNLNHGVAGNISVRLNSDKLFVTPTGYDLSELRPEDIVKIDMQGNILAGKLKPTSEWKFHAGILKTRPDAGAVIHVHSPFMTAFATANIPVTERILPEFVNTVKELPVVPYQVPHSKELADAVCKTISDHDSVLLANHGSVTVGKDLFACLSNVEISEFTCEVLLLCKILGKWETITKTKEE